MSGQQNDSVWENRWFSDIFDDISDIFDDMFSDISDIFISK